MTRTTIGWALPFPRTGGVLYAEPQITTREPEHKRREHMAIVTARVVRFRAETLAGQPSMAWRSLSQ
jgi:hypothetical protein